MKWFKIGGREWDVRVISVKEGWQILYGDETGRTMASGAPMSFSPIGTFWGHTIKIGRVQGKEAEYNRLIEYISIPRYDPIDVELPHLNGIMSYKAYVSQGNRELKGINPKTGVLKWGDTTLNIIAAIAQETPDE